MGLCQGKAAPIEPSSGPAPVIQANTPAGAANASAAAGSNKMELTDEQIYKWIALGKTAQLKR